MRRHTLRTLTSLSLISAAMLVATGCKDTKRTEPEVALPKVAEKGSAGETTTPTETKAATNVKVELANHEELRVRLQMYKGRVIVVDAWSTSCLPCMKEFPHLVELARRWPEDVVCISVNLDFAGLPDTTPESCVPAVTKFLQSKSADPPNLVNLVSTITDEEMSAKLEIESIPAIFVYDRAGALAKKITVDSGGADGVTYDGDVVPLVESLIEK